MDKTKKTMTEAFKEGMRVGETIGQGTRLRLMETLLNGKDAEIKMLKAEIDLLKDSQ